MKDVKTFEEAKQEIRGCIKYAESITNKDFSRGWESAFTIALEILELVTDKHKQIDLGTDKQNDKSEYYVAASETSDNIYVGEGYIENGQIEWKNKRDVTKEVLDAIATHLFFIMPKDKKSITYKTEIDNIPISLTLTKYLKEATIRGI